MSLDCKALSRFLDGQMSATEQGRFREHLGGCEACARSFGEALQLELLSHGALAPDERPPETKPSRPPPDGSPPRAFWKRRLSSVPMLVAALVALLFTPADNPWVEADMAWLVNDGPRVLEARVTYVMVDSRHQPFVVERSSAKQAAAPGSLPLHALWKMDARGDVHGVATAYLLSGAFHQAQAFLERLPPSADKNSDLALLALEQARREGAVDLRNAHLEKALGLLSEALRASPRHPQALWNRALVMRELGLMLQAADAFGEVAKLGEPGWSTEAAERERALRESMLERGRGWKEAYAATRDLMTDMEARLPVSAVQEHPGVIRAAFYDVLRTAPTRKDALRLLPLAHALDEVYGGRDLQNGVSRVAGRDFARRGPLVRRYAQLVLGGLAPSGAVMDELRRSGEEDLYLGALILATRARLPHDSEALVRLADASGDSWLRIVADGERSRSARRSGEWWKAERQLLEALESCQKQRGVYRCLRLEKDLTDLYLELHRPAEAFQHAWSGWFKVQELREWAYEQTFLSELADVARYQNSFNTARAYLEESLLRMPEDCAQRTHVHRNLALLEWQRFRPALARASLERALECEGPLGITGAVALSELARSSPWPHDERLLRRALAELRRGDMPPGREALLLIIEGQFEMERSHDAGQALIGRGLSLADQTPESVDARKAWAFGYSVLVAEAGRARAWDEALALMGRQFRLQTVPARCVLAAAVHHERTVIMVRGPWGTLKGAYSAGRTEPLGDDATGLVPDALLQSLEGCEHVDVLASPPVQGMTGLLPETLAWSYHVGRGAGRVPVHEGTASHLVVTEVASPPSLNLPRLAQLTTRRAPDPLRVELRGSEATPSRVLKDMTEASEVEIHAHGLFNAATSDASMVVLAPDLDGRYALTADQIRQTRLRHAPLVLLAACGAAKTAPFPHESFSLPTAFIEAGASAVLAATVEIPDSAGAFFEKVRECIRGGARPSVALRDMRAQWLREHPNDARWLPHVLLFE